MSEWISKVPGFMIFFGFFNDCHWQDFSVRIACGAEDS